MKTEDKLTGDMLCLWLFSTWIYSQNIYATILMYKASYELFKIFFQIKVVRPTIVQKYLQKNCLEQKYSINNFQASNSYHCASILPRESKSNFKTKIKCKLSLLEFLTMFF